MELHLLSIGNIDVLIEEDTAEEVSFSAEISHLGKASALDELHAGLLISRDLLGVELVDVLGGTAENEHLDSVLSDADTRCRLVERAVGNCDRLPLLVHHIFHVVDILFRMLASRDQVQFENVGISALSSSWPRHNIDGHVVHDHSRGAVSGLG